MEIKMVESIKSTTRINQKHHLNSISGNRQFKTRIPFLEIVTRYHCNPHYKGVSANGPQVYLHGNRTNRAGNRVAMPWEEAKEGKPIVI
jgi:hypothetical protein